MKTGKKGLFNLIFLIFLLTLAGCGGKMKFPVVTVESNYENALNHYLRGNLDKALSFVEKVEKGDPEYSKTKTFERKIRKLKINIAERYKQLARVYENAGIIIRAKEEYHNALALAPESKNIKRNLRNLELKEKEAIIKINTPVVKKVTKPVVKKAAPVVKKVTPIVKKITIDENYKAGVARYKKRKYSKAIASLNKVLMINPSYKDTIEIIVKAKKERVAFIEQHLKKGIFYYKQENLKAAIGEWDMVLGEDPDNEKALGYRKKAVKIIKKLKQIKKN